MAVAINNRSNDKSNDGSDDGIPAAQLANQAVIDAQRSAAVNRD